MKKILLISILLFAANFFGYSSDTLNIKSQIKNVTVFFDGAQITRQGKINIPKGKHLLVLSNLPAEINPQSIQIDNNNKGKILSVKHELTYPNQKSKIIVDYEDRIKKQKIKLKELKNKFNVYNIEEKILMNNSVLNKKDGGTSISEIREASIFYRAKLNEIKQEKLNLTIKSELINEKIQSLYSELNKIVSKQNKVFSKIIINIDSKTAINTNLKISYYVLSAGWMPLYDFRVNSTNEPLNIVYNAKIYQSTGEDWKNVNLTISTNRPSLDNNKPELKTWFINRRYQYQNKTNKDGQSTLKGQVIDNSTNEPIPFANITVNKNGKIITGTVTDYDGRYTIKPIKSGYYDMKVTYIGYEKMEIQGVVLYDNKITYQDFRMKASAVELEAYEIVEYKAPLLNKDISYYGNMSDSKMVFTKSTSSLNQTLSVSKNQVYFY